MKHEPTTAPWLSGRRAAVMVLLASIATVLAGAISFIASAGGAPGLAISQVPLQLSAPVHPQVLLAIGNSESMDGNLSGAIMVGSGSLGAALGTLNTSSSPVNYLVPPGFTPPVTAADSSGNAPYTVTVGGNLVDNGDSRLNVAKGGVSAILNAYMQNTDFGLLDYNTYSTSTYTTYVYQMSPSTGGFTFTNTPVARDPLNPGDYTVANPCYNYLTATSATVQLDCTQMVNSGLYTSTTLNNNPHMLIGASSDDPKVNDVLYAGYIDGLFVNYGASSPPLSNFTLQQYNNGQVSSSYSSTTSGWALTTTPTNAGYVPTSPQVMYAMRGFGYGGGQSPNTGKVVVPMTSAGTSPTSASVATAIASFTPYLQPETNNAGTGEIKSSAGQAATAGLLTGAKNYLATTKGGGACPPQQYVVLISDGLPTMDMNGTPWPPLGSASGNAWGLYANFNADGSLTSSNTNDQALADTINALTALKNAGVNTYIIGLGAGVDPSLNPAAAATLKAMAIAGGTSVAYPATSPAALVSALNTILISIQSGSLSTTQSAVNSSILKTGSVQYQANFTSNDTPYQDWTGDLRKTALDVTTGLPTGSALWSARTLLDTAVASGGWSSTRKIATWNPALNSGAGGGAPFQWANLSLAQKTQLGSTTTLEYLRGDQSQELSSGGTFRNRSHILGDIVNSTPQHVGTPAGPYFSSSYFSFVTAQKTRADMLYVGANDGMLHAFQASSGQEQFAFVPNGVLSKLNQLTLPLYNQGHQFFVDGSPQTGDVQFSDASWHTLLVGGENAGGQSIYALDITSPSTLTTEAAVASAVLWEFSDADMGYSFSSPQIAPVNASAKFAVFFGNGYNSASQKPWLFAVNPQTGQKLSGIDLCAAVFASLPTACNSSLPNGLSSVSVHNADGLVGAAVTQVYAGDLQGNLWAIDVSNASPSAWTVRLLFQARDPGGNPQAITTPPVVTLNPNYPAKAGNFVMFGTGQFLTAADLASTQTQTAYGVWDQGGTTPYTRSNLQPQTLSLVTKATSGLAQDILTDTSNVVDFTTQAGWYDDLLSPGQRFMTNPSLLNGKFIATLNTPPANACTAQPNAMLLEVSYATGGAPAQPILDINGDGAFNSSDQYGGKNPVGLAIGQGYASSPTILYPPNQPIHKNITLSGGSMTSILNKSSPQRTTSWWQIQ